MYTWQWWRTTIIVAFLLLILEVKIFIKIYLIFEFYTQLVPPYLWRWTLFVHVWFSTSLPRLVPYGWADLHETINLWKKVHSGRTTGAMHVMVTTKIMRYLKKIYSVCCIYRYVVIFILDIFFFPSNIGINIINSNYNY
jgi:hypothetical protein